MSIVLEHLTKRYGRHAVVNDVSLEIADGEFFVLLGSSGSGKTTVLNMVAGIAPLDEGRILLHGRDVTRLPTRDRHVGFVFQNYALFQHMTVADNIEFGMAVRRVPAAERRRRRDDALELVGLVGMGRRMPRQLSGGQQQRVALARALATRPEVLLLDEPLGALDAKIRVELRRTLRRIQRELGIATILVTHDQEEAFELADRMGVMSFGRLLEVGTPADLYRRPQSEFVATFLGTANLLVTRSAADGTVALGRVCYPLDVPPEEPRPVQVLFRPEDVQVAAAAAELPVDALGEAEVEQAVFVGAYQRLRLRMAPLPGVRPVSPRVAFGEPAILVEATREPDEVAALPLAPGDRAWLGVRRIHALAYPGLQLLVLTDGSPLSDPALSFGGQLARLAQARALVLGYGQTGEAMARHLQEAKETLGSGLSGLEARSVAQSPAAAVRQETDRRPVDLVILAHPAGAGLDAAADVLAAGEHHLLLVPAAQEAPGRALICVATGEPGKADVLFAGRLLRHLGASATVMTVLPQEPAEPGAEDRARRFLDGAVRSLRVVGVPAEPLVRSGAIGEAISRAVVDGGHDLLVLGAPLPDRDGRIRLDGVVGGLLSPRPPCATLVVRSDL